MGIWRAATGLVAVVGLVAVQPASGSAQSADAAGPDRAIITSPGLIPAATAQGTVYLGEASGGPILIGRDQDIIGAPIDFARMPRPGAAAAPGVQLRARLPLTAAMPSRLPLLSGSMTSRFGMRRHPLLGTYQMHSGVDLAAPAGSPVYAPSAGYVSVAAWSGGYGLLVAIEHGGGMQTRYGHLSQVAVASGQYVDAGTVIGYVGSTGLSTGPHLHYEVRVNGVAVNPLQGAR